jgi:hypothetical protein
VIWYPLSSSAYNVDSTCWKPNGVTFTPQVLIVGLFSSCSSKTMMRLPNNGGYMYSSCPLAYKYVKHRNSGLTCKGKIEC